MNRLTEKHFDGKGYYMRCSERLGCDGKCGDCVMLDDLIDRLAYYEDLEEQGQLVVLPCKVGDTVYAIKKYGGNPIAIIEDKVQMIGVTSRTTRILLRAHHDHNQTFQFGKTVFLTREEAEAALAKMDGESGE